MRNAYDHQMIARSSHICCIAAMMNRWTDHDIIRNHPPPAIGTHYAFMFFGHRSLTLLLFPSTLFSIIYHAAAAAVLHKYGRVIHELLGRKSEIPM